MPVHTVCLLLGILKNGRSLSLQIVNLYNEPNLDQIICLGNLEETLTSKLLSLSFPKPRSILDAVTYTLNSLQNLWVTMLLPIDSV